MSTIFTKIFKSKNRTTSYNFRDKRTFKKINLLLSQILEKKFNFYDEGHINKLNYLDLQKIDNQIRNNFQKNIVHIIKPEIKSIIKSTLDKSYLENIRVGVQCKDVWKNLKRKRIKEKIISNIKDYKKPLASNNLNFPTPPHQDLSHNGFRSSSVLIFYIPVTVKKKYSNNLEIANFKKKVGLYPFGSSNWGYPVEIKKKTTQKLNWNVPLELRDGKIFVFDAMTAHRSSKISKLPRIAINIKIQPNSLNYLYKSFNHKKNFKSKLNKDYRLSVLAEDLENFANYNNALNFELAILKNLQKKYDEMYCHIEKLLLYKPSDNEIEKIIAGGLFRKTIENITVKDMKKIYEPDDNVTNLSCVDSILRTIN